MKKAVVLIGLVGILQISLGPALLSAQVPEIIFNQVQLPELSRMTVNFITQDQQSFIWLATTDGLYRYDGNGVKTFLPEPNNPASLSARYIRVLHLDSRGYLWIGTQAGGLNRLDRRTGKVKRYLNDPHDPHSLSNNNVFDIIEDCNGNIWVATNGGGACALSPENQERGYFHVFKNNPKDVSSINSDLIWTFGLDTEGQLWIGGSNLGVNLVTQTHQLDHIRFKRVHEGINGNPKLSTTQNIYYIFSDQKGGMWGASGSGWLYHFASSNGRAFALDKTLAVANDNKKGINVGINWVTVHPDGSIWFATDVGISLMRNEKIIHTYQHNHNQPGSLPAGAMNMVTFDQQGTLWGATTTGSLVTGVVRQPFQFLSSDNIPQLSGQWTRALYEDSKSRFWVGIWNGGGLFQVDPNRKYAKAYRDTDPRAKNISTSNVSRIFEDNLGQLWVGLYNGGLYRFDEPNDAFILYPPDTGPNAHTGSLFVQAITQSIHGYFWVGSENGLYRFQPQTNHWEGFFADPTIKGTLSDNRVQSNSLLEDPDGTLWIGVWEGGLNRFDPKTQSFEHWKHDQNDTSSIGGNEIIAITRDSQGVLWTGTFGGGLSKVVRTDKQGRPLAFKTYTTRHGLPSNIVYSIVPDHRGFLWLGTDQGICRFDPKHEIIQIFDQSNGLTIEECYFGSSAKLKNNYIAIGGVGGLHLFHPDSIRSNQQPPPVYVTGVKVFNDDLDLDYDIPYVKEIRLPHTADFFTIQFAALNYFQPDKNQFAYRLDGFDQDWVYCSHHNTATYTNLDGGEYTFRVKAANNNGIWNERGATLKIVIDPPFWATRWFRGLMILLGGLIVYVIIHAFTRKAVRERKNLEDLVLSSTKNIVIPVSDSHLQPAGTSEVAIALRESEAFFKSVYESGPLSIMAIGSRGEVLKANEQTYSRLGYTENDLLLHSMKPIVHPDDWPYVKKLYQASIREGRSIVRYENRFIRKDGSVGWSSAATSFLYNEQGVFLYSICIATDITDIKEKNTIIEQLVMQLRDQNEQLEARVATRTAALSQANEQLSLTNEELEKFTYITSHDIKEPLRNIASFVSLIRRKMGDVHKPELDEYFNYVNISVKQLYTLIEDLRNYTSLSSTQDSPQALSLNDLVTEVKGTLTTMLADCKGEIEVPDTLPTLVVGKTQLFIILKNLIENGLKYNRSATPKVSIDYSQHNGFHIIGITDNGLGIAPEFQKSIFDMFKRLHTRAEFPGSGMGLAIVQRLAKKQGWQISLRSQPEQGSSFSIWIPDTPVSLPGEPTRKKSATSSGTPTL